MHLTLSFMVPIYVATVMAIFIQSCIRQAQMDGKDQIFTNDLIAIQEFVHANMYAIKSTDKTCEEEVQYFREQ